MLLGTDAVDSIFGTARARGRRRDSPPDSVSTEISPPDSVRASSPSSFVPSPMSRESSDALEYSAAGGAVLHLGGLGAHYPQLSQPLLPRDGAATAGRLDRSARAR